MRGVLITNPAATSSGGWTRDVLIRSLAAELELEIAPTEYRGHAIEIASRAAAAGVDVVLTLGGDGTINEAINGLMAHPAPRPLLGCIPGGLANVFIRALGFPIDALATTGMLIESLQLRRTETIPLGRLNQRWFAFNAGIGLDAGIVEAVEAARAEGARASASRYIMTGFKHYWEEVDRSTPQLTVRGRRPDGTTLTAEPAFMLIVQNTSPWSFAGPIPLEFLEQASFERGLDAIALTSMTPANLATYLAEAAVGVPAERRSHASVLLDCDRIEVECASPMPAQVDGDSLGTVERAVFEAVPAALEVLVPGVD